MSLDMPYPLEVMTLPSLLGSCGLRPGCASQAQLLLMCRTASEKPHMARGDRGCASAPGLSIAMLQPGTFQAPKDTSCFSGYIQHLLGRYNHYRSPLAWVWKGISESFSVYLNSLCRTDAKQFATLSLTPSGNSTLWSEDVEAKNNQNNKDKI